MTFSYLTVAFIGITYLAVLFGIAFIAEKGWLGRRIIGHPITYVLSLGIFASAWSFYGVIELANRYGYGVLAYYLGTGALFLFSPFLLKPLIELAKRFQINSMADLLVFRYHSHMVGGMVTLAMFLAMAPLLAVQIQAVADTIHLFTRNHHAELNPAVSQFGLRQSYALIYCAVIALFAVVFGSSQERHKGLISVMAFESLIKVFGLLVVGLFALFAVFGGFGGMDDWLAKNPDHIYQLSRNLDNQTAHGLMLMFIATAVSMPHIFHVTVVENPIKHSVKTLPWAFPLFLLVMALPVFPILWAGHALELESPSQYFPLSIPMNHNSSTVAVIAFLGGLSAATGAMITIALAMATMILNHWLLPVTRLRTKSDFYRQIIWMRRIIIFIVLLAGFSFYLVLNNRFSLTELAMASFIATLQILPGVIAVTHWSLGNRRGLAAGFAAGMGLWIVTVLLPMVFDFSQIHLLGFSFEVGIDQWQPITVWSLGLNASIFVLVSAYSKQSHEERYSAELCSDDELSHPMRLALDIRSPEEIVQRLSTRIGESTASKEVSRALARLNLTPNESRPYALRRLRDEIEANLSSLMGIAMASEIMDQLVPYKVPDSPGATDINLIESRLGQVRSHLTGLAAELNNLRLYHRRTLEELPLPTCSIGQDMEVLMWNTAMVNLTNIKGDEVVGSHVENIIEPWGSLLTRFALSTEPRFYKREIILNNSSHWITLHKAAIPSSIAQQADGQVILLEDVTELQTLEKELVHSERLASVGRLAAGVAHEIGNPVTGIACLAQNLKYDTDNDDVLEAGDQILSLTNRVNRIVQSLVSFSHSGKKEHSYEVASIRECAQEAINLLSLQKEKNHVNFINDVAPSIATLVDSQRIIQVFVNLLSNSRDASPEGSDVIIDAKEETNRLTIRVTDFGSGIPEAAKQRIFEPFFTTKEPGEGTGLGLAMVYSIIEDHNGSIDIESPAHINSQNGTRFIIQLPLRLASDASKSNTTGNEQF